VNALSHQGHKRAQSARQASREGKGEDKGFAKTDGLEKREFAHLNEELRRGTCLEQNIDRPVAAENVDGRRNWGSSKKKSGRIAGKTNPANQSNGTTNLRA